MSEPYDLFIIGGGINGCGIARDAVGRGLTVALAEMGDLAQGASSASTKLIHGGLRYLERYEFRLVREALRERETLLAIAPHLVEPLRFVLPHATGMRPAWMLQAGLFLYDRLGGRKSLPRSRKIDLREHPAGQALHASFSKGFEYSDCRVDDARLAIANAMDAAARGGRIMTRTRAMHAEIVDGLWHIRTRDGDIEETHCARAFVNAGGAWVEKIAQHVFGRQPPGRLRLVKGSHIVVRKLFDHDCAYIFQNEDGRIVFAIPYEDDFTLVGTTDVDFSGDPQEAAADDAEIAYLLAAASRYFAKSLGADAIVWTFSGVRGLYDDGAGAAKDATRDYHFDIDTTGAPLLTIYGGKVTTYRTLAEAVLDTLSAYFPQMPRQGWTAGAALPGGDFPRERKPELLARLQKKYFWLEPPILRRMMRAYGTLTDDVLAGAAGSAGLGRHFGAGLYEREVRWLREREWARSSQDVLWRRSKLGLRFDPGESDALARFMDGG